MELKDLVGKHILSGVQIGTIKSNDPWYEDAQTISFELDGVTYMAVEDPSDGYRSCMDDLLVTDRKPSTRLPDIEVLATHQDKDSYGSSDDILVIRDIKNGKKILEVGTSNCDDYYPCFICEWIPKNLSVNELIIG